MRYWLFVALLVTALCAVAYLARRRSIRRSPSPMSQSWMAKERGLYDD